MKLKEAGESHDCYKEKRIEHSPAKAIDVLIASFPEHHVLIALSTKERVS